MSNIEPGTYSGNSEGLTFEFRIERTTDAQVSVVSGDITRGSQFISSLICATPQVTENGQTITGALTFRGNPELFTGSLYMNTDERGIGSFQVTVDLEGGHRDVFAGRVDWQGSFLRRLAIEIDGLEGTQPPAGYNTRGGSLMTIERAFADAGFDVSVRLDQFSGRGTEKNRVRGYTLAEIHAAMAARRSHTPVDRLYAHVFVCSYLAGRGNRGVLGVMYDFGQNDLNRKPREGVAVFYDHPMLSDPRVSVQARNREYVYTLVHEVGHALNLLHSFDKSRPAALSWMNYPHLYPRGYEASKEYDGTSEFWRRFEEGFDAEELRHLRHASPREIRAGGFAFGVYEDRGWPFNGSSGPRRTRLGANPLRATRSVEVAVGSVKREYDLGEPIFLRIGVKNTGPDAVHVPDSLDPSEGYVRLIIQTPTGRVINYRPPVRLCKQAQLVHLPPGEAIPPFEGLPLFLSADGPIFTEPGVYQVIAELTGVDGTKNVYSEAARVRVRPPDEATESFAYKLWDKPAAMEALYLRHPLTAKSEWDEIEQEITEAQLKPDNTTESYFNYIAGLGWMTPFAVPNTREKQSNFDKAMKRMSKVNPHGLPPSVADRQKGLMEQPRKTAARAFSEFGSGVIVSRPEEEARAEVPPSGLFGSIGLTEETADKMPDPFVRIVPSLSGKRRFADIVSWNIENLYKPANHWKIPKVAELIRNFRCDFWGVQEISKAALAQVKETVNSSGQTRYEVVAVEGSGQQSGAIFRTDTTSVTVLELPDGFFKEKIDVEMTNGETVNRRVFLRLPLLCDVRVRQEQKVFDFRCAVVHLKSTDTSIKDRGNGMRLAAARELARWIEFDSESGAERDYLVLGDMNAETAKQGLESFAAGQNLKLLSVGMQDKYGTAEALTRVASKRMLDHIVITGEAFTSMPPEDKEEQIIVRSDREISDWTKSLSDHVPVAVRFIISDDQD